ncbi:TPA: QVPTGV class sortase B protein-sorting domain-containing protein [Streptococcus suis]
MKKNKLLLATTILALTLGATTQSQVTAETASPSVITNKSSLPIKKTLTVTDDDVLVPNTSFTFVIEADKGATGKTQDGLNIKPGSTYGLTSEVTVSYENSDKSGQKTKEATFDFSNVNFDEIGVYRYTVSEKPGDVLGIGYDNKKWTVDVYVGNGADGKLVPIYIVSKEQDGKGDKKPIHFENSLRTTSLKIEKTVTGNTGELQKGFTFKLTLSGNSEFANGQKVKIRDNNQDKEVTIGQEYTFTLQNGQSVELPKLPLGITYKVTEVEANADGYTTTAALSEDTGTEQYVLGTEQRTDLTSDTVLVTNHRETLVPTGVVGTLAPFAVLSIAAIGGVLYITKRKKA